MAGIKSLTGFDSASQKIVNVGDPSAPADAATKAYVDQVASGLMWKQPAKAASTGNLTLSGTQTVDGIALIAADRVLVKDQSTGSENGVYAVAAGAWSRTTDFDSAGEVDGATLIVTQGTVNGDKSFTQTASPVTIGTTTMVFAQVGGGSSYTADGQGIELSSTTFSLELNGATLAKSSSGLKVNDAYAGAGMTVTSDVLNVIAGTGITVNANDVALAATVAGAGLTHTAGVLAVVGDASITVAADSLGLATGVAGNGLDLATGVLSVKTGTASATGLEISSDTVRIATAAAGAGLTGGGGSALAVDTSVVVRKYASNNTTQAAGTPVTYTHNLNTRDVTVTLYEGVSGNAPMVLADIIVTGVNTVTVTTATLYAADTLRIVVQG